MRSCLLNIAPRIEKAKSMLKILLADEHALFWEGLKLLLSSRSFTKVAGEATTEQAIFQKTKELLPDLCIADIAMPCGSILHTVSRIKIICPSTKILVFTELRDEIIIRELLEAGVDGFVLKTSAFEELDAAIKVILSGHRFLSPAVSDLIVNSYIAGNNCPEQYQSDEFSALSLKERKILCLFCSEMPPKAIAIELGISRKTVDTHKRNIKKKLGVESDIGLIRLAIEQNFPASALYRQPKSIRIPLQS
jgi:two-component system, NarL family, response regulator NreC